MSDTKPTTPDTVMKSKLTVKDLGNPKLVSQEVPRVILGTIIGRCTGTKVAVDAKGEAFTGIVGTFEGTRNDNGGKVVSAVLYLPSGFHEGILEQMEAIKDEKGASVDFAFEIGAVLAANPIGYSYAFRPLVEAAKADPLAALRAGMQARLAPPAPDKSVDAKPSKPAKEPAAV